MKIKFSLYIRKFRAEQSRKVEYYEGLPNMRKCANISPYMRMPLVIYGFATAPF